MDDLKKDSHSTEMEQAVVPGAPDLDTVSKGAHDRLATAQKHRRRLQRQKSNASNAYHCKFCKTDLTDEEFYKIHVGSKAHKKTLRKLGVFKGQHRTSHDYNQSHRDSFGIKQSYQNGSLRLSAAVPVRPELNYEELKFVREKYKTRSITTEDEYFNSLLQYIYYMVSFLSIKLTLDPNIVQMKTSVNDKKWQSFGDMVFDVTYSDRQTIYAIKCKQVTSARHYIESLRDAKVIMDKEYSCVSKLISKLKPQGIVDMTQFAIFTKCETTSSFNRCTTLSPKTLNTLKTSDTDITEEVKLLMKPLVKRNEVLNTNTDKETIYSFHLQKYEDEVELPNMHFYTNQNVFDNSISDLLKKRFDKYKVPNINESYRRYIENWSSGKLGGNYKLTKREVVLKIGEILLNKYIIAPKLIRLEYDNFDVWNSVIEKVDLTVIDNEQHTISKICRPINALIESIFAVKIDTVSRSINLKDEINRISDKEIKAYLFEEVNDITDDIPLSKVYTVLWKAGRIPLLMSSEKNEEDKAFIVEVIAFMKSFGVKKKFLLQTQQCESVKSHGNVIIFRNLDDIKHLVNLQDISIRVTDYFKLSLDVVQLTDKFFFRWITPNIFFDMALGRYSIRHNTFKKDIENELKIVLSDDIIMRLKNSVYYGDPEYIEAHTLDRLQGLDPLLFR